MPRAGQPSLGGENPHLQGCAVVCAIRRGGIHAVLHLAQKHLPALDAIHFDLLLLAILQVEGRHSLKLKFLRHSAGTGAEGGWSRRRSDVGSELEGGPKRHEEAG